MMTPFVICDVRGRLIVTIDLAGQVTLGEGASVDDAARAFWEAVQVIVRKDVDAPETAISAPQLGVPAAPGSSSERRRVSGVRERLARLVGRIALWHWRREFGPEPVAVREVLAALRGRS